ncbi:hypothetical protein F53441_5437 [Fusarium austroafricanum]|uniref:Uncharacterized protein n=1 Tax=Fusarium austroafricanum TaxID=2364996 RepID=A0A8H4KJU9_9HYPO|nr:hypothetical protein F53441_5437 [Fusarium austroafricanum]
MGCNNSRHIIEMESRPIRPVTLSSHSAGSVRATSSIFQDFPDSSEFSIKQISDAFGHMAEYLKEYGVYLDCVAVDGAVNTLLLGTRQTTHDVEFILPDPHSKDSITLSNAASYANTKADGRLGENWFGTSMQLLMPRDLQINLISDARLMGGIVFEDRGTNGGLTVYAAPWQYAICSKLERLNGTNRPDDMEDAVAYMYHFLSLISQEHIVGKQIFDWCTRYHQNVSLEVLKSFEKAYHDKHGNWPLWWPKENKRV